MTYEYSLLSDDSKRLLACIVQGILTETEIGQKILSLHESDQEPVFAAFCHVALLMDEGLVVLKFTDYASGETGWRLDLSDDGLDLFEQRGISWGTA